MAKKTFMDNPAVTQFISSAPKADAKAENTPEHIPAQPRAQEQVARAPVTDLKSRRVQLLLKPQLYARAKEVATKQGISLNECTHRALELYLSQNQ